MSRYGIGKRECLDKRFHVAKAWGGHHIRYECEEVGEISLNDMITLRDELNVKIKEEQDRIENIKRVRDFYNDIEAF